MKAGRFPFLVPPPSPGARGTVEWGGIGPDVGGSIPRAQHGSGDCGRGGHQGAYLPVWDAKGPTFGQRAHILK